MKYSIKQYPDRTFTEKMDLVRFIQKKYAQIFAAKKAEYKTMSEPILKNGLFSFRYEPKINVTSDLIEVKAAINSTNVIDGHMDLHLKDIWNKTVSDNPTTFHLKQHENKFEGLISNSAKNFNENINFKDFGLNIDFKAVANFNQFVIDRKKEKYMFDKYANGEVLQHSVGMLYVNLALAYYDEDSEKNMDFFEKAKSQAINPEVADEHGFVWVVSEARKREGSAVVMGSNSITPTIWVKDYTEPPTGTGKTKPPTGTSKEDEAATALQTNKNFFTNLITE